MLIIFSILIIKSNKKYRNSLMVVFCIVNIIIFGCYYFHNDEGESSVLTNQIKNNFNFPKDNYNYLDYSGDLNINFSYILQIPSIENRLHIIKEDEVDFMNQLGYVNSGTEMFSFGGTIFSDILFNNRYIFSKQELSPTFYNLLAKSNDMYLYEIRYHLNYVIPYKEQIYNDKTNDYIINQNKIYQILMNTNQNIIHELKPLKENDNNIYNLNEENFYYFISDRNISSHLNDSQEYKNNNSYYINNGLFYHPLTVNEKKKIEFNSTNKGIENLKVYYINKEQIESFVNSKKMNINIETKGNKRIIKLENKDEKNLLLPINYDDSFKIVRNGKNISYTKNFYNMISIELEPGENTIEISYMPKYLKEGIIITLISLLITIVVSLINKKINILNNTIIINTIFGMSCFIAVLFIIKVYILTLF